MANPYVLALFAMAIPLSTGAAPTSISGSATYRERMVLPSDAVFETTLEDVSRADAPATVLGRTQIKSPGQVPIHFTISYDPGRIEPQHRYGIRARILVGSQQWFTTDAYYPVSLDAPTPVEVLLTRSSASAPSVANLTGLPATFIGDLPCADCEGLRYHLDLLDDGMYFLRRTYLGRSSAGADEMGNWTIAAGSRTVRLQSGNKVSEQFEITSAATLRMLDRSGHPIDSKLNYDLKRQPRFAPIEPALQLRGMYSYMADSGMFTECSSGKRLAVAQEGDNAALEKAYSSARPSPGTALLAAVNGRIAMRPQMEGQGQKPTLVVDRFQSITAGNCGAPHTTAAVEEKYWKLVRLGGEPVKVTEPQREPNIILHSDTKRVSGSGGCNRIVGSYTLHGEQIAFKQMAGTMMACPDGMEQEQAFLAALARVARWGVTNEQLQLFDASGALVAQFESRYLR